MRKILLFFIFVPHLCFSQLTTHHVMRALNGSTFDVRTSMPNVPNGQILVGNASGIGTAVTMSGDATLSNTGVLSLNSASAGYSKWTATGANIYRSSFVGIGQTSPTYEMDIRGNKGIKLTTASFGSIPNPGSVNLDFVELNARGFSMTMDGQTLGASYQPSLGVAVAVSRPQPGISIKNAGSGAALLIEDGEVGILTATPAYPLDVTGDINSSVGFRIAGSAINGKYLRANGTRFVAADLAAADIIQGGATTGQVIAWNGSVWAATTKDYKVSTTIDFASTSAGQSTDVNVTLTGVIVGDPVSIGLPVSPPSNSCFTAWVSATNTVTVRFNNYSASPIDPASATYNVIAIKY